MDPAYLTAAEAARAIAAGTLTSEALVAACLERIAKRDPTVRAFAHVDRAHALAEARRCDASPRQGPLHGIPIAIKDVINTKDLPTQHNSSVYTNHRPGEDAAAVAALRSAGAVVIGKTDTVEFASVGRKAQTRNPHALAHTPGGSSSGSAAAVADFMVPLALGTQTGGSTIRPASFCGVAAMKPSYGIVNWNGAKHYSPSFDTIGWFGRAAADLALVAQGYALLDQPLAPPPLKSLAIGFCRTPHWHEAEPACHAAIESAAQILRQAGVRVEDITLPPLFDDLTAAQDTVMHGEGRFSFLPEYRDAFALLHQETKDEVENKKGITLDQWRDAYTLIDRCRVALDPLLARYDAWLTPAVPGEAPEGLESTGLATFNRMWTALHVPCITLPGFAGARGLPIGIQLVGRRLADARLLAVAAAVEAVLPRRP